MTADELMVKARVRQCKRCPLFNKHHGPVSFSTPTVPKLIRRAVQGEAPGASEDTMGVPFVGAAGTLLRETLDKYTDSKTFYYLNTVSCWPDRRPATPNRLEISACRNNLVEQLGVIKPDYLLVLGGVAFNSWWTAGRMSDFRGVWWKVPYTVDHVCWVMTTWHPSYILRKRHSEDEIRWQEDIAYFSLVSSQLALPDDKDIIKSRTLRKAPIAGMLQGPQLQLLTDQDPEDLTPTLF